MDTTPPARGRVLVTGGTGLIGRTAVDAFLAAGWHVVAMSRGASRHGDERHGDERHGAERHGDGRHRDERHADGRYVGVPVDLRDERAVAGALHDLPGVTHLAYTSVYEKPGLVAGWSDPEQMATNRAMLDNVLRPLVAAGDLEQVTIMQGTKAYGAHLHAIPCRPASATRATRTRTSTGTRRTCSGRSPAGPVSGGRSCGRCRSSGPRTAWGTAPRP
ncbi:hypothetical protein Psuf_001280 [Phytohabitans suffuscus]|uniref:NAD-dependent epimerase/dehydratase domain-containing protein n=1 Tax=Phytohabitans suffuscus TaxID=624315 RepID=A0A6F8Y9N7_9ACTN|nr:NAD-dependent epimerase/dehydratase family protein [Phytohabitans suffuscus]BCB82815.1 hypothetical protein Psuf_001280 [Phytohabitans suffuscus]